MIKDAVFWKNVIMGADRNALIYLQSKISSECIKDLLADSYFPPNRKAFLYNIYNDRAANWSGGYHIAEHIDLQLNTPYFKKNGK